MFKDKGALMAEIKALKQTSGDQATQITTLQQQLATVTTERDTMRADLTRLEQALTAACAERTTVQAEVTHQLASAGMPQNELPQGTPPAAAAATGIDERLAEINTRIEASKDPKEKGRLANEAWDLMRKRHAGAN